MMSEQDRIRRQRIEDFDDAELNRTSLKALLNDLPSANANRVALEDAIETARLRILTLPAVTVPHVATKLRLLLEEDSDMIDKPDLQSVLDELQAVLSSSPAAEPVPFPGSLRARAAELLSAEREPA